jgi:hypothetical protein
MNTNERVQMRSACSSRNASKKSLPSVAPTAYSAITLLPSEKSVVLQLLDHLKVRTWDGLLIEGAAQHPWH